MRTGTRVLAVAALLACATAVAFAQEGAAPACNAAKETALAQEVATLKASLESIKAEKATLSGQLSAAQAESTKCSSDALSTQGQLQAKIESLTAEAETMRSKLATVEATASASEAKIAEALAQAKASMAAVEASWLPVWADKHLAIIQEKIKPTITKLQEELQSNEALKNASTKAHEFTVLAILKTKEFIAAAKEQSGPMLAKAKEHAHAGMVKAKEHVEAAWNHPQTQAALDEVQKMADELKAVVLAKMKEVPATREHATDANATLIVYIVFAAPLVAILLPLLAYCVCGSSSSKPKPAGKKPKKTKK